MFNFFEKLTRAFPEKKPTQPPNSLVAFLLHHCDGFKLILIAMSVLSALLAISEVILLKFIGQLVDILSKNDPSTFLTTEKETLINMALLVLVVMPLIAFIHSILLHQSFLGNYPMSIRWLTHRYLLKQSVSFYQNDFAGRIATKVMQTSLASRETVMKTVDLFVYILVYLLSMLIMIASTDIFLMIPILIWFVAYIAAQLYFVPKLKKISTKQADARSTMTGRIVDSYTNIMTIKLFSHTQRETQYAKESMDGFMKTVYQQMRLATRLIFTVDFLNYLLLFSIAALSIYLWMHQSVTIGVIAIAISIALRIQNMSKWIMWEISALFENIGTVIDGIKTFSKSATIQEKPNAKALHVSNGAISFQDISFCYSDINQVIQHLNLEIKPGEKIGLVGHSGAGKSTLINLLLRFYDLNSGKIKIDQQSITDVSLSSLTENIGVITQDTSLLHRSIRENIAYGCPKATDEQIIAAAKKANAHDFIESLTDNDQNKGYDAQVGERGVKLSGGQRQRIAIARVLLKDAPILIMDEATSALDSESEAAIQKSFAELMKNKTVIAIAHRLSTIAAMDRLIVLEQGEIIEQGTHQELLEKKGIYASLWSRQTGGFIHEDQDIETII